MKRLLLTLCCTLATALFALTWTDPETNITWTYTLSNGKASLGGGSFSTPAIPTSYAGALTIPATMDGYPVSGLRCAFCGCSSLTSVVIPEGVTSIGNLAFYGCSRLKEVTFLGDVPEGWGNVYPSGKKIYVSQAYAGKWNAVLSAAQRGTMVELVSKAGVAVTAEMTTPKTMRVTYSVESERQTVKVRAVAWKDGVRSFANIVLVKTVAEGSPEVVPNGGEVATGVEHTFVWQVSANWATDLDKVAMEILVEEGTLLPQEKITIPALDDHPEMIITRNGLASWQLFDALVWCYAEGDEALVATDGVVKVNGTQVANGSSISTANTNATALLNYLYGKMGYKVLAGEDLAWARAATRLELADSGLDQVSVKITEE
ncbi:MAG: leucine-rich repeat protein [Candidatus Spyradenecus sp.]